MMRIETSKSTVKQMNGIAVVLVAAWLAYASPLQAQGRAAEGPGSTGGEGGVATLSGDAAAGTASPGSPSAMPPVTDSATAPRSDTVRPVVRSEILIPIRGGKERGPLGGLPPIAYTPGSPPGPFDFALPPGATPAAEYFNTVIENDHRKLGWLMGVGLGGLALLSSKHRGGGESVEGGEVVPPVVPPPPPPPPVTTVPEPATAVLVGSGLGLAFLGSRWLRRRREGSAD